ncbi:hypothetical protein FGE12_28975 [Aggregicoccus sp. 17bor-14]|uniref:hypothetical protein n=1 Tax=Myxococcaceae TaxID=31 RepID=UPI00129CB2DC|nr:MULTISPECIES: hypothetical protein [Myxococcaceae]MBF5046482.1 hypothetical protein [Simulacricoccus sp. 17bor-14]MRI92199.1 hypothetical protein [Aggregicoccus sp. 17bor-14]
MRPRVLVLSDSEELLPELTKVLDRVGFETGCARVAELERDEVDLGTLLHGFDPQVVVLELALPYARSGAFLRELRARPEAHGRGVVLVSANARAAARLAGLDPREPVLELLLAPEDLAQLVTRVAAAARVPAGEDLHAGSP